MHLIPALFKLSCLPFFERFSYSTRPIEMRPSVTSLLSVIHPLKGSRRGLRIRWAPFATWGRGDHYNLPPLGMRDNISSDARTVCEQRATGRWLFKCIGRRLIVGSTQFNFKRWPTHQPKGHPDAQKEFPEISRENRYGVVFTMTLKKKKGSVNDIRLCLSHTLWLIQGMYILML